MRLLLITIAVWIVFAIIPPSAQAFCGDYCVEGQHVRRDPYGNEIKVYDGVHKSVPHMVSRNYQPAYHELGEGESS